MTPDHPKSKVKFRYITSNIYLNVFLSYTFKMKKFFCLVDVNTLICAVAILTARINNVNRHLREGPNYKRVSRIMRYMVKSFISLPSTTVCNFWSCFIRISIHVKDWMTWFSTGKSCFVTYAGKIGQSIAMCLQSWI